MIEAHIIGVDILALIVAQHLGPLVFNLQNRQMARSNHIKIRGVLTHPSKQLYATLHDDNSRMMRRAWAKVDRTEM